MTRTTMRWTVAGALALAAVGIVPAWRTAEAAPNPHTSENPFAGGYVGSGPFLTASDAWQVDVSGAGRVTGSASFSFFGVNYRYRLSGTVAADGAFSYTVDLSASGHSRGFFRDAAREGDDAILGNTSTLAIGTASLTKNADGSVTGTDSGGVAIVWTPR